jgi:hypothetical protein
VGRLTGKGDTDGSYKGSYSINSGLQGALKFFAGSGPGRFRTAGHMTFKNDAPEWRTYHSGGTLKVRTVTTEKMGLNDIDYGLIMKVKGGLTDSKTASLDVNLELSYPSPVGTDYDVKKNKIETSVMCGLGQTLVQDTTVLILLAPQLVGAPTAARPVSEETKGVEDESKLPVEQIEKQRRDRKRSFFFF